MDFDSLPQVIAIVGSRKFPRKDWVEAFVQRLPKGTIVVSGGADGVDSFAESAARLRGLRTKIFHIDPWEWTEYGRRAGMIRNNVLIEYVAQAGGALVAFSLIEGGRKTRGTDHVLNAANARDIRTYEFTIEVD